MLGIVGIFACAKVLVYFWDMIILANSFGVCHILFFFFFFFFFLKSGLGPSPWRRQNSEYLLSECRDTDRGIQLYSTGELAISEGRTRSDILSLLLPREVHFLGKHSCQGHTAAIRHERASPKPIVSKTAKTIG